MTPQSLNTSPVHRRRSYAFGLCVVLAAAFCDAAKAQPSSGILQATFLGGGMQEDARAMAIAAPSGDIILAGSATAAAIPGTAGGAQPGYAGRQDAWVARLSPDLRTLRQATYLGGTSPEQADAVAIDPASGDVVVAGFTSSDDFPGTAGGAQSALAGPADAFVARFSADLKTLRQATYLGGSGSEGEALLGVAIEPGSGQIIVTGTTSSDDFPGTAGGAQPACGGTNFCAAGDGFVARLSADLRTLVQATYLGEAGEDDSYAVAIHPITHEIFVGGDSARDNTRVGVVACLSTDLTGLKGRVEIGNAGFTVVWGLAIDPASGDVVATGETSSPIAGLQHGAQPVFGGGASDAFAARFDQDLFLLQSTYLGGSKYDGMIVTSTIEPGSGAVIVTGETESPDFPSVATGAQAALDGSQDVFVARLSANLQELEQATYLGGGDFETSYATKIAPGGGEVVVAGRTLSKDFPAVAGGAQPEFAPSISGHPSAAFAARVSADLAGGAATPATTTPTATPTATTQSTATATATMTGSTANPCDGDCDGDGQVTVDDLIRGVNVALGNAPISTCPGSDANRSGTVTVDELIRAVSASLNGCS